MTMLKVKVKVIPQKADVAQGVPGRLRSRIFLTFGSTRVVGRQPYAPAAFTQDKSFIFRPSPVGGSHRKKSPVTPPGINPGISRLVAQCLNHHNYKVSDSIY